MRWSAVLVATGIASAALEQGELHPSEIQEKVGLEWATKALKQAGTAAKQALNASQQVGSELGKLENASHQVGSELGKLESEAENATSQLTNASSGVLGGAARQGKKVAFTAALAYLGTCHEYFAQLSRIREVSVPRLAEAFQGQRGDPSASEVECNAAVQEGLEATIDAYMKDRQSEEVLAVKWITADRAHVLCNEKLMRALQLYESIREKYPKQYEEALQDKLLLEIVTEELVAVELDRICGHTGGFRKDSRLFSEIRPAAPAGDGRGASVARRAAAALLALAGASLLAALAARRHTLRSRTRGCRSFEISGRGAEDEEWEYAGEAIE